MPDGESVPCWWRDNGGWRVYQIVKPKDLTGWKTTTCQSATMHFHQHVLFPTVAVCTMQNGPGLVGVTVKVPIPLAPPVASMVTPRMALVPI